MTFSYFNINDTFHFLTLFFSIYVQHTSRGVFSLKCTTLLFSYVSLLFFCILYILDWDNHTLDLVALSLRSKWAIHPGTIKSIKELFHTYFILHPKRRFWMASLPNPSPRTCYIEERKGHSIYDATYIIEN